MVRILRSDKSNKVASIIVNGEMDGFHPVRWYSGKGKDCWKISNNLHPGDSRIDFAAFTAADQEFIAYSIKQYLAGNLEKK